MPSVASRSTSRVWLRNVYRTRKRLRRVVIETKSGGGQGEPEPWRRTSFPSMPCGRFCPGSRSNDSITTEARVTSLSIRLEARSAAHRCYRAYAIDVATDLFGAWLVDMSYGRIGTVGRSKIRSFATIEDAQDQV